MKIFLAATTIVAGLATMAAAGAAHAALITINSTAPTWSNIVGGANRSLNVSNGQYQDVRWGVPDSFFGSRSGLGFNPSSPPLATVTTGTSFLLGTLRTTTTRSTQARPRAPSN